MKSLLCYGYFCKAFDDPTNKVKIKVVCVSQIVAQHQLQFNRVHIERTTSTCNAKNSIHYFSTLEINY